MFVSRQIHTKKDICYYTTAVYCTLLTIRNYSNIKMGQQSALVFFHSLPLVDLFLALGITQCCTCTYIKWCKEAGR